MNAFDTLSVFSSTWVWYVWATFWPDSVLAFSHCYGKQMTQMWKTTKCELL